jgi:tetratricopeptide (TPR) repeat protein
MKASICLLACLFLPHILLAQRASITEESRELVTYPFGDPDPVPILTERNSRIYPYNSLDGYSLEGRLQTWKVIRLENDYIEVYILPQVGGKVWGAIEKSTGKEFIYRNEVMKFRNIALRGPWTSGGIEFNFGFIGHTPSTATPVDYVKRVNYDGSVSCIVGNIDLPSRTQWRVEIRLPKDKAYFETNVTWYNPTPVPQSYYNWMTAAAVVSDDLEFFYPGNRELDHDGSSGPWPVDTEGHEISKYAANAFGTDRSSHVVGEYNDFMGGYYHASGFGFGHWAFYDDMPGRKLWLWAQSRSGAIWEDLLTNKDGQYMEFQAGRTFNQYQASATLRTPITYMPFSPGLTDRWSEIWFPVKDIGGLRDVSPAGVLNVVHENGQLRVGINALSFAEGDVVIKSGSRIIYREEKQFKPMDVYTTSVPLNEGADYEVEVEGMDLRYGSENKNLINRPFITPYKADKESASYLYHEGMQQKENRNYKRGKEYLRQCLEKDPQYIDAMAALIELYYRTNLYDSALYFANRALQLDAYHPGANYFAGITYRAVGNQVDAMERLGWASRSPEYRSAAYVQMAGIQLQLHELTLATHYANQALSYNRFSFNALEILVIIYRQQEKVNLADSVIKTINALDPLNHFADYERYLLNPIAENDSLFKSHITNELPYQAFLELAIGYYNLGLKEEACRVLEKAPGNPLVALWKAFLNDDPRMLEEVTGESPAFVFPFRTETASALAWAVKNNSHWKLKYYLGLNYWAIQRDEDAMQLFQACGQEPDYAIFYLSRAFLVSSYDEKLELMDLQMAQRLAPDEWRTYSRLIDYYENKQDYALALTVSTEATRKFRDNSTLALQYATALLNRGEFATCIKTLERMHIIPFEGSSEGKVIFELAYLNQASALIKDGKYREAMGKLEKSKEWPENLGVGMPYEPDNRIQDYLEACCMKKLNFASEATELQLGVVEYTKGHYADPSFNNLLALSILEASGEKENADALIRQISNSATSTHPVQQWVVAYFNKNSEVCHNLEINFEQNRYFSLVKEIYDYMHR